MKKTMYKIVWWQSPRLNYEGSFEQVKSLVSWLMESWEDCCVDLYRNWELIEPMNVSIEWYVKELSNFINLQISI